MDNKTAAETSAEKVGFSHFAPVNLQALVCREDVREMCSNGRCGRYGHSWSCPPACGSLEDNRELLKKYTRGMLVETTGELEDEFDYEGMVAAEKLHKNRFAEYVSLMRSVFPDCLPLGAGTCTVCEKCTYPDAPCRFPNRRFSSMEAFGLWVSDVCEKSGLAYNYGKNTITYISCVLY